LAHRGIYFHQYDIRSAYFYQPEGIIAVLSKPDNLKIHLVIQIAAEMTAQLFLMFDNGYFYQWLSLPCFLLMPHLRHFFIALQDFFPFYYPLDDKYKQL
ncbi:MAG: hypothetical protein LBQ61_06950, partial [Spirochaetales bacterium]|nr:hypothetical protein [Spirochaetales bacterium]